MPTLPADFHEKSLRKPTFAGGVPVTLGDGRDWILAVPIINFAPRRNESGGWSFGQREVISPAGKPLDSLIETMVETDGIEQLLALLEIGVELLSVNYDLDDDLIARILPFRPDDESNREMWTAIAKIAQGDTGRPKPSGGG